MREYPSENHFPIALSNSSPLNLLLCQKWCKLIWSSDFRSLPFLLNLAVVCIVGRVCLARLFTGVCRAHVEALWDKLKYLFDCSVVFVPRLRLSFWTAGSAFYAQHIASLFVIILSISSM